MYRTRPLRASKLRFTGFDGVLAAGAVALGFFDDISSATVR